MSGEVEVYLKLAGIVATIVGALLGGVFGIVRSQLSGLREDLKGLDAKMDKLVAADSKHDSRLAVLEHRVKSIEDEGWAE